jgi:hypothetical protein
VLTAPAQGVIQGSLSIARVRIHDGVLNPCQVFNNYLLERDDFTAPPCPTSGVDFADTHCTGLEVIETGFPIGNTHQLIASGTDGSGDPIVYTFMATDGVSAPRVVGPTTSNTAFFALRTGGPWSFSVTVDDRPECDDQASDATCTPGGGGISFRRGDADTNGAVNITDAVRILNVLFLGIGTMTCDDASDSDDNGAVNITDAVRILNVLFLGIGVIPAPGTDTCGGDPTDDALTNCVYAVDC